VKNAQSTIVIYLSLQDARAQTEDGFYRALLSLLSQHLYGKQNRQLRERLQKTPTDRTGFSAAIRQCGYADLRPVFCLDEFEALLKRRKRFGDDFYDGLRTLMDLCPVMFVVASKRPLEIYRRRHSLTSPFFNQGHTHTLRELSSEEAHDLVRLPSSTVPGSQPALAPEEQRLARRWAGRRPYPLQLAADALWQAKREKRDVGWAHAQYREQVRQFTRPRRRWLHKGLQKGLSAVSRVGEFGSGLGSALDEAQNRIVGMLILIVVILVLLGLVSREDILDILRQWLGG
jgi:hypothetical protein